jgi:hypothetical protein
MAAMIANVRRASAATGRMCRVAMDLPGPKLRTGPLEDGPSVIKLRPTRNTLGRVVTPAVCRLSATENPAAPKVSGVPVLPVPEAWDCQGPRRSPCPDHTPRWTGMHIQADTRTLTEHRGLPQMLVPTGPSPGRQSTSTCERGPGPSSSRGPLIPSSARSPPRAACRPSARPMGGIGLGSSPRCAGLALRIGEPSPRPLTGSRLRHRIPSAGRSGP